MDPPHELDDEALLYELNSLTRHNLMQLSVAFDLCLFEGSVNAKLKKELNELKLQLEFLEEEIRDTKRTRWCSWCLEKAVYLSQNQKFYCTYHCEQLDRLLSNE